MGKGGGPIGNKHALGNKGGGRKGRSEENVLELAQKLEEWIDNPKSIWFEDFCLENGCYPDEMWKLAKKSEEFGRAYKKAKLWQKNLLCRGGLTNKFNAGFTKFLLSANFDMVEKTSVEHSGEPQVQVVQFSEKTSKDWRKPTPEKEKV